MSKITFLFGIHNHQPIGNFESVFEQGYDVAYAPFLDVLWRHPSVKWNLHCTGILWDWLERKRPDYLKKVAEMARRGQVELLSGGFYEPILPVIPDEDKIGQIRKLSGWLKDRFGSEPKGMWCAERVWEPHLPKPIREAGIDYTVLDDTHFLSAGLSPEQLYGYYRVEEQHAGIDIFPISQELRYTIPFMNPEESLKVFRRAADANAAAQPALVMADDGEKFGMWPGTNKLIYGEKWLERFLKLLEDNASWIETATFSGYRARARPLGKVYLPTASYFEMSEWSLPTASGVEFSRVIHDLQHKNQWEQVKRFAKGGIWRNFFAKYAEANAMYKKMLRVSSRVHEKQQKLAAKKGGAEKSEALGRALDALWAGQCNCSYWHGAFGGLYLPFLRSAIYQKLIDAERAVDDLDVANGHKKTGILTRWERTDFDGDGADEVIIESAAQNLYLSPAAGGSLVEWDFKPASVNITNVLTRRPETYHQKLKEWSAAGGKQDDSGTKSIHDLVQVKEKGLENILFYDWYRRAGLIDHFLHPTTTLETFKRSQYGEQGDFVTGEYQAETFDGAAVAKGKAPARVALSRQGKVWTGDRQCDVRVTKTLTLQDAAVDSCGLEVVYRLENVSGGAAADVWFAPEFNFSFSVPEKDQELKQAAVWRKDDPYLHWTLELQLASPGDLWIFPLETVSNSESGYEKTFQGLVVLPQWKFALQAGETQERKLHFRLKRLD